MRREPFLVGLVQNSWGMSKGVYKAVEKIQEALKKVDEDLKEVYLSYPVKKLIKSYRVSLPTQHPLSK